MRRLYFLIPTIDSAKNIVDELLLARIEQRHIHIAAADQACCRKVTLSRPLNEDSPLAAQPELLQVSLLSHCRVSDWRWVVEPYSESDWPAPGLVPGHRGQLLMMVDVPKDQVEDVTVLIKKHHPEVEVEGTEPVIPAFP